MTFTTLVTGDDMICRLTGGDTTVMTGVTGADDRYMVYAAYIGETDRVMTVVTCLCTGYM